MMIYIYKDSSSMEHVHVLAMYELIKIGIKWLLIHKLQVLLCHIDARDLSCKYSSKGHVHVRYKVRTAEV